MEMNTANSFAILRYTKILIEVFFFFNDTATTEIYTLSLHDALPISPGVRRGAARAGARPRGASQRGRAPARSEEHTSELQSQSNLVCRLLLEKKKNEYTTLLYHTQAHKNTDSSRRQNHYPSDPLQQA